MFPYHDENECLRYPTVNTLLIGANIVAFGYMLVVGHLNQYFITEHAVVPTRILHHWNLHELGTIFSALFMHIGFAHIIGNLWALYLFGDNVEDRLGHWNYLAFYLACGLVANVAQILSNTSSAIPSLGASGAIAGVMGAYMIMFPNVGVRTWITWFWFMTIPAWVVMGAWFILQCVNSVFGASESIAWYAHIGGFLTGVLLTFCLKPAKPPDFIELDGVRIKATENDYILHRSELVQSNDLAAVIGFAIFFSVAGYMAFTHPQNLNFAPNRVSDAKKIVAPSIASIPPASKPLTKEKRAHSKSARR